MRALWYKKMNGNDDEYKAASRWMDPFALVLPEPRDSLPSRMFSKGPMHIERRGGRGRGWESIKFILTRNPFEGPTKMALKHSKALEWKDAYPAPSKCNLATQLPYLRKEEKERGMLMGADSVLLKASYQTFNNQHLPSNTALKRDCRRTWWDRGHLFANLVNIGHEQ